MIWKGKPQKDVFRWRKRFALIPRRYGDFWIWLEPFEWKIDSFDDYGIYSWRVRNAKIGEIRMEMGLFIP